MPDPTGRHAASLAALDRQIEQERDRLARGRHVLKTLSNGSQVVGLVYDETSPALEGLRGRRSILVRHAPVPCRHCHADEQHYVSAAQPMITWPPPDYRDAAAGLPEGPDA